MHILKLRKPGRAQATTALTDRFTIPQYLRPMIEETPAVHAALAVVAGQEILGIGGGIVAPAGMELTKSMIVSWEKIPDRGAQNANGVLESATPTLRNVIPESEYNFLQIIDEAFGVSYERQAASRYTALATTSETQGDGQDFVDPQETQVQAALKGVSYVIDNSILNGTRTQGAVATASRSGGLNNVLLAGNSKAMANQPIDKDTFLAHLQTAYENGALCGSGEYIAFCTSAGKLQVSKAFKGERWLTPGLVANVAVNRLETDFGVINFALAKNQTAGVMTIADPAELRLVFLAYEGKGVLFREKIATSAAQHQERIHGAFALRFGHPAHILNFTGIGQ